MYNFLWLMKYRITRWDSVLQWLFSWSNGSVSITSSSTSSVILCSIHAELCHCHESNFLDVNILRLSREMTVRLIYMALVGMFSWFPLWYCFLFVDSFQLYSMWRRPWRERPQVHHMNYILLNINDDSFSLIAALEINNIELEHINNVLLW